MRAWRAGSDLERALVSLGLLVRVRVDAGLLTRTLDELRAVPTLAPRRAGQADGDGVRTPRDLPSGVRGSGRTATARGARFGLRRRSDGGGLLAPSLLVVAGRLVPVLPIGGRFGRGAVSGRSSPASP